MISLLNWNKIEKLKTLRKLRLSQYPSVYQSLINLFLLTEYSRRNIPLLSLTDKSVLFFFVGVYLETNISLLF